MTALSTHAEISLQQTTDLLAAAAVQIAPQWPLDQMIAVNPWWPKRTMPFTQVCAEQQLLAGTPCLMRADWYLQQWQQQITPEHLQLALTESNLTLSSAEAIAALSKQAELTQWQRLTALLVQQQKATHTLPWPQLIQQQLSQFLALYYQYPERFNADASSPDHAYHSWLSVVRQDKGLQVLTGKNLSVLFKTLPDSPHDLLAQMQPWLDSWLPTAQVRQAYFESLLQSLSGWAGWQAWLDWQQGLQGKQGQHAVSQLLYMLLGWDWVLWQYSQQHNPEHAAVLSRLQQQAHQYTASLAHTEAALAILQVWQRALELSVQQPLLRQLQQAQQQNHAPANTRPRVQAAFCIDVRSEPMRRALEQQDASIQTLGFAGFFGLPIAYHAADSSLSRPQLPGLLAPALQVTQIRQANSTLSRQPNLGWKQSFDAASSSLGMVEAAGATKLLSLIKRAFLRTAAPHAINKNLTDSHWQISKGEQPLSVSEQAELAAAILSAMGLKQQLAATVLLFGHGSDSCNNPHAAALDCGACGGQTGEVNVKVLAQMLNDAAVRAALASEQNIDIPADTQFYGAMHHTTSDELEVYQAPAQASWLAWLDGATRLARQQRAVQFGVSSTSDHALARFFKLRTRDWAQVRPEWGLANNAAFIVAPRSLTKNLDLQGRCFLHDYDATQDSDFSLLHTIMTAPMVVTNWINLQYYASVVAPEKYGSGNKLLHNVVAGHVGVFEGNGGDLRSGLAWQSVHDGKKLMHQPVRLSVVIAAPKEAIANIINSAPDVAALVNQQWLWLYQLDDAGTINQWQPTGWQEIPL